MAEDFERGQGLEQQLQTLVEQHATSQLNKTRLDNVNSRGAFLLHDADAAFRDGPRLRSAQFEVKFRDESGFGSGVTAGFYARIAKEFLRRAVNLNLPRAAPSRLDTPSAEEDTKAAATGVVVVVVVVIAAICISALICHSQPSGWVSGNLHRIATTAAPAAAATTLRRGDPGLPLPPRRRRHPRCHSVHSERQRAPDAATSSSLSTRAASLSRVESRRRHRHR